MSEDNELPSDDEAQRLLDELAAEGQTPEQPEPAEPEPEPKASKKKAGRKKAAEPEPEPPEAAEPEPEPEPLDVVTNTTPRVLCIMHATLAPEGSYAITERDLENDRFMRKVHRALELGVLK